MPRPRGWLYHQIMAAGRSCLNISAHHVNKRTFTPAARIWLLVINLIHILHPLLKLLPGFLTSQPGKVPDTHPPGALQEAGLCLYLLEFLRAELLEPVMESLEDGAVGAWGGNTGGGWMWALLCMDVKLTKGCNVWTRVLVLEQSVSLFNLWGAFKVLHCMDSGLTLVQVINAFTGQCCSLFIKEMSI